MYKLGISIQNVDSLNRHVVHVVYFKQRFDQGTNKVSNDIAKWISTGNCKYNDKESEKNPILSKEILLNLLFTSLLVHDSDLKLTPSISPQPLIKQCLHRGTWVIIPASLTPQALKTLLYQALVMILRTRLSLAKRNSKLVTILQTH